MGFRGIKSVRLPGPVPIALRTLDPPFLRRLDLLPNPYGPSPRVFDAVASLESSSQPSERLATCLRERLAGQIGVPPSWIVMAAGIDDLVLSILLWRRSLGPLALFPPTDIDVHRLARITDTETIDVARSDRFQLDLNRSDNIDLTGAATAVVMSPNDPTGTLLEVQDAVRLTRRADLLVVDERHGQYAMRSALPLVREFDGVVVLRTLETWAGLTAFPFAYAVARPKIAASIADYLPHPALSPASMIAATATLDDLRYINATIERIQIEKSRLYRTLRKLNMVRPLPSWGNFLLARIERGERDHYVAGLRDRGIVVHRPTGETLDRYVRISAVSPDATLALKQALIDLATDL